MFSKIKFLNFAQAFFLKSWKTQNEFYQFHLLIFKKIIKKQKTYMVHVSNVLTKIVIS